MDFSGPSHATSATSGASSASTVGQPAASEPLSTSAGPPAASEPLSTAAGQPAASDPLSTAAGQPAASGFLSTAPKRRPEGSSEAQTSPSRIIWRTEGKRALEVIVRCTTKADFDDIQRLTAETYPHDTPWKIAELESHLRHFPDGQLVAIDARSGELLGMAASLLLRTSRYPLRASWEVYTEGGLFTNHDPAGDTLYGAEVMVSQDARGRGVGRSLYRARRTLARRLRASRIRAGARLAGYHRHAHRMAPETYVAAVISGALRDPTLSFQLNQGFEVIGVARGYLEDPESHDSAAVIEWKSKAFRERRSALELSRRQAER